jgi:hypothetical protein
VPDPGNPVAWNRFAYVYNNPVNYTDPSGHAPVLLAAAYTVVDTAWDIADVYSDIRDCFGDSDSMACAMLGYRAVLGQNGKAVDISSSPDGHPCQQSGVGEERQSNTES